MGSKEIFKGKVENLIGRNYVPLSVEVADIDTTPRGVASVNAVVKSTNFFLDPNLDMTILSDNQSQAIPVENGSPGLGYIPWGGASNCLPKTVMLMADSLPYTSQGTRFLIDLTVGLGPHMMYRTSIWKNGSIKNISIPYEEAGEFILSRIEETDVANTTIRKKLQDEYEVWQKTNEEYQRFLVDNNIEDIYQKLVTDQTYLDICFPTVGLSTERRKKDENGKYLPWSPKIVRIGYLPAVCTRLEEMDDNLRINNVYYSEMWRNSPTSPTNKFNTVSYPTLMPHNFLTKLKAMVKADSYVSYSKRHSWYCAPIIIPSGSHFYYPVPQWWSVFTSKAYQYASTLINDQATARQNSTMWGKMIFINNIYLQAVFAAQGADTEEEKQTVRNQIWNKINEFLKRKENNGKTIALDSILSPDGKTMMPSVEIVDVPQLSSSGDFSEELEEITSIIFFAMGVHPGLIGAIPGKTKSNSGTYQRELTLLKQNQLSSRQRQFLRFFQNINVFNGWDSHAKWIIKQQVLTTLDRSPEGTVESSSE